MTSAERNPDRLFAVPNVEVDHRPDGTMRFRSREPLHAYSRCVGDWLVHWAEKQPDQPFLVERGQDGSWKPLSYSRALQRVKCIGAWLLELGTEPSEPVVVLSDNGVEHALMALGSMHVGIPVAAISPAYSLLSKDFAKLKAIFAETQPGVVYAANGERFASALNAVAGLHAGVTVIGEGASQVPGATLFSELFDACNDRAVDSAFAAVGPDTVAKLLFTSGSTGAPKGVLNTQRMLCSNQQQMAQVWPFTAATPPVIVDWLPWSHTFGGNHNFNLILKSGGTLYIDAGRPLPGLFDQTVANLRDIAPTVYFNVPRGYDMLVAALRSDAKLRDRFFERLQLIFYAAAALPQNLWDALGELALEATGSTIPMVSAWGSTETAPLATSCHFQAERAGTIGVPVPGCELKLVPSGGKLEVRVRGPNVTPGYWKQPELTRESFDSEGYYLIGDAVAFVDEDYPERGLLFDGRVAEDFKLLSGTWVSAGTLRIKAVAALAPVAQDIVVAGHDRDDIRILVFPNIAACRRLCGDLPGDAPIDDLLMQAAVRDTVAAGLKMLRQEGGGSSTYPTCAHLMAEPPSIDAGEITDKGYINQRAVLTRRQALVDLLYAQPRAPAVITADA